MYAFVDSPFHTFLDQTAGRVPNRIAIIFGGMELTYAELKELSDRFATALFDMGIRKGDREKIREVVFLDAIPVSAAGKVLKKDLRDKLIEEGKLSATSSITGSTRE